MGATTFGPRLLSFGCKIITILQYDNAAVQFIAVSQGKIWQSEPKFGIHKRKQCLEGFSQRTPEENFLVVQRHWIWGRGEGFGGQIHQTEVLSSTGAIPSRPY